MKNLLFIFGFILLTGCSPKLRQSFSKLSKPERVWVTFHAFKAKEAYLISLEAERVKDSMKLANSIVGNDNNGGKLDAFKHSYWMARLTQDLGKNAANSLGNAHEKGNYETYQERELEDGFLPDKPSSDMDLFNNKIGIKVGVAFKKAPKKVLMQKLLDSLQKGKLRILSKDIRGRFLDCQHKKIPLDSLKNKWDTKKCLVPSNQISP